MTDLLEDLVATLAAEVAGLARLLPLLEREADALGRGDVRLLLAIAPDKEACAQTLAGLARTRQRVVERLAGALGLGAREVTLTALLDRVPRPPAALGRLRGELRALLPAVQARNRRNGFLAERSAALLGSLLAEILAVVAPGPTYAPSGRADRGAAAISVLDRRA
jgi:flagellar biosynthesis/type III secretory pathway chaperone